MAHATRERTEMERMLSHLFLQINERVFWRKTSRKHCQLPSPEHLRLTSWLSLRTIDEHPHLPTATVVLNSNTSSRMGTVLLCLISLVVHGPIHAEPWTLVPVGFCWAAPATPPAHSEHCVLGRASQHATRTLPLRRNFFGSN